MTNMNNASLAAETKPATKQDSLEAKATTTVIGETGNFVYVVQKGDTLSEIALRFTGRWRECYQLARENHIDNPDIIEPGQKIKIKQEDLKQDPSFQNHP